MLQVRRRAEKKALLLGPWREAPISEGVTAAFPDMTPGRMVAYEHRTLPATTECDELMAPFLRPGTEKWDDFFDTRKIVVQSRLDGRRYASVTSNIYDKLMDKKPGSPEEHVKKFEVAQLLTDTCLHEKFELTPRRIQEFSSLAIVDTSVAATRMQAWVRRYQGYDRAIVSAGRYAGSWKWARDSVTAQAASAPRLTHSIDSLLVGDQIFFYGPPVEDAKKERWSVSGPVKVAALVAKVHAMVMAADPVSVGFALGMETTILAINVFDGSEFVCPVRDLCYGDHNAMPYVYSDATMSSLSAYGRGRLLAVAGAVHCVTDAGLPVASAVRVGPRHVLINEHVVAKAVDVAVDGVTPTLVRQEAQDMWIAKTGRADAPAWVYRDPVQGEQVFLLYRRLDEVQVSDISKVLSVSESAMSLSLVDSMVPGASGAAVVAVKDFAMLGIFEATSLRCGVASVFSPAAYTELCTADESDLGSAVIRVNSGTQVYERMSKRGFSSAIDTVVASMQPVYADGVHVGMAQAWGDSVRTVCDPGGSVLSVGVHGPPRVFHAEGSGWFSAKFPGQPVPAVYQRSPVYGEKVFLVGRDEDGGYFSTTTSVVEQVGVDALVFRATAFDTDGALPLLGAMVVAEADSAVLGVYVGSEVAGQYDEKAKCVAIPPLSTPSSVESPEAVLAKACPFLRVGLWPPGLLGAISGDLAGSEALESYALIGESAMRTFAYQRLQTVSYDSSGWQRRVDEALESRELVRRALAAGLGKVITLAVSKGGFHSGDEVAAKVVCALAALILEAEPRVSIESYCDILKVGVD